MLLQQQQQQRQQQQHYVPLQLPQSQLHPSPHQVPVRISPAPGTSQYPSPRQGAGYPQQQQQQQQHEMPPPHMEAAGAVRGGALAAPASLAPSSSIGGVSAPVMPPPPPPTSFGGASTGSYSSSSSGAGGGGSARGGPRYYPTSETSVPLVQTHVTTPQNSPGPGGGGGGGGYGGGGDGMVRTSSNNNTGVEKRIDPAAMPRPVVQANRIYDTAQSSRKAPPSAGSSFVVQDGGNCSPRHMRTTMCCPPLNAAIAKECPIPFAVVATPFAAVEGPEEAVVEAVEFADSAPPRCSRFRGYFNP